MPGSNFCQFKNTYRGNVEHFWKSEAQSSKVKVTRWPNIGKNPVMEPHVFYKGFWRPICNLGILSQPAGGDIPCMLQCQILSMSICILDSIALSRSESLVGNHKRPLFEHHLAKSLHIVFSVDTSGNAQWQWLWFHLFILSPSQTGMYNNMGQATTRNFAKSWDNMRFVTHRWGVSWGESATWKP